MAHYSNLAHELLAGVEAAVASVATEELMRSGIKAGDVPSKIALAVGEHLIVAWGGQHVYFPRDIARRNARIDDEFDGENIDQLARKYRLSDTTIYSIISSERERRRIKQIALPGISKQGGWKNG